MYLFFIYVAAINMYEYAYVVNRSSNFNDRFLMKNAWFNSIIINFKALPKAQQSVWVQWLHSLYIECTSRGIYHAGSFVALPYNHDNQVPISAIQSRRRIVWLAWQRHTRLMDILMAILLNVGRSNS